MKILFVVPYVPSLIRVRPYQLIRHLAARGHEVTVATLWTDERERHEAEELKRHCDNVSAFHLPRSASLLNSIKALASGEPLQAHYSWSPELAAAAVRMAPAADVVHVEHLRGSRYALAVRRATDRPVVWDSVDCISYLFEQAVAQRPDRVGRLVNRLELPRTRRYEALLSHSFDRVVITSETDRRNMLALPSNPAPARRLTAVAAADRRSSSPAGPPDIRVVPNGVDTAYFTPNGDSRDEASLVFSGKMSYHANAVAAEHLLSRVMPLVWARRPDVRVAIVGKDPGRSLLGLADRSSGKVIVTGRVDDIRPYLRRASVAVVPVLYGAGCQNKVLEAMACATPVLSSPKAIAALEAEPGREVLVAVTPEDFATSVVRLLDDPGLRRTVGRAGRRYVETNHCWGRVAARLEGIYEGVLREARISKADLLLSH